MIGREMKKILFLCLLTFCCSLLMGENLSTVKQSTSTIAFTVAEKDLFPEGITYDPKTEQFFLGSILKKKIIAVGKDGSESDFVKSGQDGLSECLGLKVDTQRRRLWALSYDGKWSGDKIASVHIFDIDSKKLVKKLSAEKGKFPAFNDLVLTEDGGSYVTDCIGNAVYHVTPDLEKLELFVRSDELLRSANGIVISPDNSFLFVASETKGIVLVDLATKKIEPIANRLEMDTKVIDGLMYYKNSLIAILNPGFDPKFHCIVRYFLSDDGKEITGAIIIDKNNPLFGMPTTGVIADDNLYCLAATLLDQLTVDYKYDITKLRNPLVLKYHLN
jgi:hypothetical protein